MEAVHAITKEITTLINTTYIIADTVVEFPGQIKQQFNDLPVIIVLDNTRGQHGKLVKNAAVKMGITLLLLHPYPPNLNIIERLWKFTKKQILYARYYDSPNKFHTAIKSFFSAINQTYWAELRALLTLHF